jgi:hypothetical protein
LLKRESIQIIEGSTPQEAFLSARELARHQYGHSGRSGTIADATGASVIHKPALEWEATVTALMLVYRRQGPANGDVLLVPIGEPDHKRVGSVAVDVTGLGGPERDAMILLGVQRGLCMPGESVLHAEARGKYAEGPGARGITKFRYQEDKYPPLAKDKVTRFYVVDAATKERLATFPNAMDARRWARAYTRGLQEDGRVIVTGEVSRHDGGPLYSMSRTVAQETVRVKARVALMRNFPPRRWAVAGLYM